jgi:hypothetical protein
LVEHIVLIRWTEQASQEAIASAVAELSGMKSKIEGIVDLSCGANFSDRSKGYAQGMVVRFVDRAALAAFYAHSEHRRVVQTFVKLISADILVVDYEF